MVLANKQSLKNNARLLEEFHKAFLPGKRIGEMSGSEDRRSIPDPGEMDVKNKVVLIDPVFAKLALKAKAAGIPWIFGGTEFLGNHLYGHWVFGTPIKPSEPDGAREGASDEYANGYALEKSSNPVEDYSSMLATCMLLMFYYPDNDDAVASRNGMAHYGKEEMVKAQINNLMDYHGANEQLTIFERWRVVRKTWKKFLELEVLMREEITQVLRDPSQSF